MKKLGSAHIVGQKEIDDHAKDLFRVVALLFCRYAQIDASHRPVFQLEPTVGTGYKAIVGCAVRDPLERKNTLSEPRYLEFEAEGSSPATAAEALRDILVAKVRDRIKSDVGALELAGKPFDWSDGYGKRVRQDDGVIDAEGYEREDRDSRIELGDAFDPITGSIIKKAKVLPKTTQGICAACGTPCFGRYCGHCRP